uniref:RNA-binding protein 34 n=1 Tax=Jaculus jaculus TaxID=51337 RepID=UPI001E1B4BF4|nr:RNA-binding protein 34 [Jaculus jaculus]
MSGAEGAGLLAEVRRLCYVWGRKGRGSWRKSIVCALRRASSSEGAGSAVAGSVYGWAMGRVRGSRAGVCVRSPDQGRGLADYVLGQVADSLRQGPGPGGRAPWRLAGLFRAGTPGPGPLFVPAPPETPKKRKAEEEENMPQSKRPALQQCTIKVKVKSRPSEADRMLASRESALASADLEETHQEQGQRRKVSRHSVKAAGVKEPENSALSLDDSQTKKIRANPEEERLKNERTVFVGNLPVSVSKKKLKSFFKEYGPIESVRFRSVIPAEGTLTKKLAAIKRKFHPDQKSINAYVVFKEEHAAVEALKRNGAQITDGFHVRVDLASETSSRDKRSVFVGNLPYKVEESAVEKHFVDCGNVMAVRIVRDPVTGVGKGFGYVLFENTDAVHLALKLNNSELMGRKLRVMRSVNKEKLKQQNSNQALKNVNKPKKGVNFASKAAGHSQGVFIGEKAVHTKKKRQKKSVQTKKSRKQK